MSPYAVHSQPRDSLELASLASSSMIDGGAASEVSSRPSISSSRRLSLVEAEDPLDDGNDAGRVGRSYSVSSTFDFAANLFPLSSTAGAGAYAPIGAPTSGARSGGALGGASLEKHKTLTYLNGLSLIIGLIIGSGIFSSPSQISSKVGSPGAAIVVWVVAGVLAWTGAASYAELGGAIPLNGGAQVYLAKTFGELAGFLFTWTAVLVLKPGSAAIIAIIMGEYFVRAVVGADAQAVNPWFSKSVALLAILAVTCFNCISTRMGTRINDVLMFLKFVALLFVTVVGVVVAVKGYTFNGEEDTAWKPRDWFNNTSFDLSDWAIALYGGLWAYDGWDNTNYVVGEFRNPRRDLPRVIHSAMPLVIVSYVLANVAYFLVLPVEQVNGSNTVAVMFGSQVFGSVGAMVVALMVSASCLGALNSSTFTAGRLVYVAGKEGYIPSLFGKIGMHMRGDHSLSTQRTRNCFSKKMHGLVGDGEMGLFFTPIYALLLNGFITAGYCVVGEFPTLVTFYGVAGYTFYFCTVLGLVILRVREPGLERPYKTWITTPIIFCCVSLFLLSRAVFARPVQTLAVVGFVVAGVPVYFWRVRGRGTPRKQGSDQGHRPWWRFWKVKS
ncbi:Amino acid/polyamine transporter I [Metarhizium album ARSEF 1941]|uniref:Amino acid/polyamine transporter I n=1 Tax=Metarhizium album (strain ARSEF 1941) TaxID=1081103 RepID=A0A0B2X7Z9_METAS|nr:Amino acid/polyamine transporter I [Metarhizium album ARSEF 1941]KHO01421.1 Amino acid/polyamine transporter I [Metarhizium album ARSEF 1941]